MARQPIDVTVLSAAGEAAPRSAKALTFDQIFDRHAGDVYRIVRRLLGPAGAADADDVTQQVFIAAHRALPRFRGEAQVQTWLYGIAARRVLMHLRSGRRRKAMLAHFEAEPSMAEAGDGAWNRMEARVHLRDVWRALLNISSKKRIVFLLYEVEGWTAPEIAERLQLREGTVRSRLNHARRALAAALSEVEHEP